MAAQFGRWNFDGVPSDPAYLARVGELLVPYGPDGTTTYAKEGLSTIYSAFHTTAESRCERQTFISSLEVVLTWDGRLDNRDALIRESKGKLAHDCSDASIVAEEYGRRGTLAFSGLVGDWAVSVWDPRDRSLVLAKDPIGTRPLFYSIDRCHVAWCTVLEPLLLCAEKQFVLDEEYLAGWFASFPAVDRTPYQGIDPVPPSSFVRIQPGKRTLTKYWDFDPDRRIRYRTDSEYEEHFRVVFAESVRRRLRSDSAVLAELSGGVDSASIVSVADRIIARGGAETTKLDTVSYYSDVEQNWDERPYFTKIEEVRGRTGCHIDVSSSDTFGFDFEKPYFAVTPGLERRANEATRKFSACVRSGCHRVVLSGTGGDEVTGGVPASGPEVADLLASARFRELASRLRIWSLDKRRPWFHLLWDAFSDFLPLPRRERGVPWLRPDFARRHRTALSGYRKALTILGSPPSFQHNLAALDAVRRHIACRSIPATPCYEVRYPYLDRDFLEFIYAVPREQVVRPGQRRSLMRRALAHIVPSDILNRKRKAFVVRAPLMAIIEQRRTLTDVTHNMACAAMGVVEPGAFRQAMQNALLGKSVPLVILFRTLSLELWLRALTSKGLVRTLPQTVAPPASKNTRPALLRQSSAS